MSNTGETAPSGTESDLTKPAQTPKNPKTPTRLGLQTLSELAADRDNLAAVLDDERRLLTITREALEDTKAVLALTRKELDKVRNHLSVCREATLLLAARINTYP